MIVHEAAERMAQELNEESKVTILKRSYIRIYVSYLFELEKTEEMNALYEAGTKVTSDNLVWYNLLYLLPKFDSMRKEEKILKS